MAEATTPNDPLELTEEELIESAKYLPRELPERLFEEERFLFPDTYGINRVRLYVRDPEWLFVHWDVDSGAFPSIRARHGVRFASLSRLTLRITDVVNGGTTVILLPFGCRSWYVHTDSARRSYRAELGVTLPTGEFRLLAQSNTVVTPRVGPSKEKASRRVSYLSLGSPETVAELAALAARELGPGPWDAPELESWSAGATRPDGTPPDWHLRGGASDVFRR